MAKHIYTSVTQRFGKVLFRGYKNGKRIQSRLNFEPELYVKTKEESDIKSLYGDNLESRKFESMSQAKSWVKDNTGMVQIYGNDRFEYNFIHTYFRGELDVSIGELTVQFLDIETSVEHGFPNVFDPNEEVLLITVIDMKTRQPVTFGARPYTGKYKSTYVTCKDESDLLMKFIEFVRSSDPDIISGWNCVYFDIAYLGARIERILGEEWLKKLSPFELVDRKVDTLFEREQLRYNIVGRSVLDLLDLYKKFRFVNRPSYKLDYIGEVELKRKKLVNPYDSFKEHYTLGWDHPTASFVDYNVVDTELVIELEDKLGLVYLAVVIAYMSKINYDDVYSPVKMWENFILFTLLERNTFVPLPSNSGSSDTQIMGGYVKEPVPGYYRWLSTFDATSLYPSIMMALNLSPETFVGMVPDVTVDKFLNQGYKQTDKRYTIGANGAQYSREKYGIIPELTEKVFTDRKTAKKKMLELKREYQVIEAEATRRGIKLKG